MANYVKGTNFATKDTLPTGDSGKIIKGTEIDNEFNSIASAVSSKADSASPALTGTPTAPTATAGANTTQLATTAFVSTAVTAVLSQVYPVGSIYTNSSVATNPSTLLGFGTWSAFGAGRVLVGFNSANALFDTAEETGGSADAVVVSHSHTASSTSTVTDPGHLHSAGQSINSGSLGGFYAEGGNTAVFNTTTSTTGITVATSTTVASAGSSGTNANYQPYITVYMWKRTA